MGSPSGTGVRVVGGRYRLIERLGRGGMGTVWRAQDELLDRTVAVKEVDLPNVGEIDREQLRRRTMREARAAARLAHPNAVTVYDVVEDGDQPWIVMQLVAARSLADVIRNSGPLPPGQVAEIGLAVLSALQAAHAAGILHRDVKPGNVLLGDDGRVVLTDFGIATLEGDPSLTSTGLLLGAPAYIAPERARGLVPGPASDLWSLGATLWTALEGRPPYDRETPLATLTAMISEDPPSPNIDGPLGAALEGMLRRDPSQRIDALHARKLLEQARDAAVIPPTEALATTLETPIPTPTEDADGGVGTEADRTQVIRRPSTSAAAAPILPAPVGPARDPRPPAPAADDKRSRVAVLAALALLLVGAVVAIALLANRGDDPTGTNQANKSPAPPTSSPQASSPPTTSPSPASAGTSAPAGIAPGTAPAGYTLYGDPSGFRVAVPNGWQKTNVRGDSDDGQFDFVNPSNRSQFLRIGYTTDPKPDPVADWKAQEPKLAARYPDYELISIKAVDYRDFNAADWDFRIGSTRVKDRGFTTGSHGHALYLSAPESQFIQAMKHFEVAAASFQPAP